MGIAKTELIDALADNVGQAQAKEIVSQGISSAGYAEKQSYSDDEAIEILEVAGDTADVSSLVSVSITTVATRIQTGNL